MPDAENIISCPWCDIVHFVTTSVSFVSLRGPACPFVDFFFWAFVDKPLIGFRQAAPAPYDGAAHTG